MEFHYAVMKICFDGGLNNRFRRRYAGDLFLAYQDLLHEKSRENFFWSPVIGHNNKSLNRLMEQGVAENHFHLKGPLHCSIYPGLA